LIKPCQTPVMHWIVFDYGEVISRRPLSFDRFAELLGVTSESFEVGYWQFRDPFDRGQPALDYWRAVANAAGSAGSVDEALAAELTAADVEVWSSTDSATLALIDELVADGQHLALLSNAPAAHGAAFRRQPWAKGFEAFVVSAEIGVAKPDPAIWSALAYRLRAEPSDCLFLDDRQVNVDAAVTAGIRAVLWTSAEEARVRVKEFLAERG
jgi:putative hydrolase of the HAD superfamily